LESEPDNFYAQSILLFFFPLAGLPSAGIAFSVALVILLLVCSAMISSSEVAFFSLTPNDLEKLKQENSTVGQKIIALQDAPRKLLATILISNNFINIAIVILSDFILRSIIPIEICEGWAASISSLLGFSFNEGSGFGTAIHFFITVVGVTALLVLFGEVAPKVYAKLNNIQLAKTMAYW